MTKDVSLALGSLCEGGAEVKDVKRTLYELERGGAFTIEVGNMKVDVVVGRASRIRGQPPEEWQVRPRWKMVPRFKRGGGEDGTHDFVGPKKSNKIVSLVGRLGMITSLLRKKEELVPKSKRLEPNVITFMLEVLDLKGKWETETLGEMSDQRSSEIYWNLPEMNPSCGMESNMQHGGKFEKVVTYSDESCHMRRWETGVEGGQSPKAEDHVRSMRSLTLILFTDQEVLKAKHSHIARTTIGWDTKALERWDAAKFDIRNLVNKHDVMKLDIPEMRVLAGEFGDHFETFEAMYPDEALELRREKEQQRWRSPELWLRILMRLIDSKSWMSPPEIEEQLSLQGSWTDVWRATEEMARLGMLETRGEDHEAEYHFIKGKSIEEFFVGKV
jgi:hypothetical protein